MQIFPMFENNKKFLPHETVFSRQQSNKTFMSLVPGFTHQTLSAFIKIIFKYVFNF